MRTRIRRLGLSLRTEEPMGSRSATAGQRGARKAAAAFADGAVAGCDAPLAGRDGRPRRGWASLLYGAGVRLRVFLRA